jgi:hypothetical protein
LLKVALNTITLILTLTNILKCSHSPFSLTMYS